MKKLITLFLTVTMIFTSTLVFAEDTSGEYSLGTENGDRIIVSDDPIHPYIHELMSNPEGDIVITDSQGNDITYRTYEILTPLYKSADVEGILELIDDMKINIINKAKLIENRNLPSSNIVRFYHEESLAKHPYNVDATFTISNSIFIWESKFSGYTTPRWNLHTSVNPLTLHQYRADPSIINSGYTYRLYLEFLLMRYQIIIPRYSNTLYYHFI